MYAATEPRARRSAPRVVIEPARGTGGLAQRDRDPRGRRDRALATQALSVAISFAGPPV